MESNYQEREKYENAKKQVKEIKEFYSHLLSYAVVNVCLLVINLLTTPAHLWFYWPMMGWGIGVGIHALKTFNLLPFLGDEWEQRKVNELMKEEDERRKNQWQ